MKGLSWHINFWVHNHFFYVSQVGNDGKDIVDILLVKSKVDGEVVDSRLIGCLCNYQ